MSQLIQVPNPAHALAVETALGGALQYVICLDDEHCRLAIEMLKRTGQGRATLVPVSAARMRSWGARPEDLPSPLSAGATSSSAVRNRSGRLSPCCWATTGGENLSIAAKLATETKYRYKIVTLEGDVVSRGLYTGGSVPRDSPGLMRRKAELDDLGRRCREKEQEIVAFSKRCRAAEQDLAELERKRQQTGFPAGRCRAGAVPAGGEKSNRRECAVRKPGKGRRIAAGAWQSNNKNWLTFARFCPASRPGSATMNKTWNFCRASEMICSTWLKNARKWILCGLPGKTACS